jgi:prepilin-type N-terminal cleavage/methylation domain-containing protein
MKSKLQTTDRGQGQLGFSLLEMVAVVAIILIVTAVAIPSAVTVLRSVHLREAGTDYANLIQRVRMLAIQNDNWYQVVAVQGSSGNSDTVFVDLQQTGTYAAGDPIITMASDVEVNPASPPALANLESQFLPTGSNLSIVQTGGKPTYGPRGLPCQLTGTAPSQSCLALANPAAYINCFQSRYSGNWEAVTVSPAGRVREWGYDPNSSTWSPLN